MHYCFSIYDVHADNATIGISGRFLSCQCWRINCAHSIPLISGILISISISPICSFVIGYLASWSSTDLYDCIPYIIFRTYLPLSAHITFTCLNSNSKVTILRLYSSSSTTSTVFGILKIDDI